MLNLHGENAQQTFDHRGRAVSRAQPKQLRRASLQDDLVGKIHVFGDNDETTLCGVTPNLRVVRRAQAALVNVRGAGKLVRQPADEFRR